MSDQYRKLLDSCGIGGVHCECCNMYHSGKDKPIMNRLARRRLKQCDRKELITNTEEE